MAVRTPTVAVDGALANIPSPRLRSDGTSGGDRYALPRWVRRGVIAFVGATIPLCVLLASPVRTESAYLTTLALVGGLYAGPALVVARHASRRVAPGDRPMWRLWSVSVGLRCTLVALVYLYAARGWHWLGYGAPVLVGISVLLVVAGDTMIVRSRSGQRAALIDALDLLMATVAVVVPVVLVAAEPILSSPHAWFASAFALWVIGGCHGAFVALVVASRVRRTDRNIAGLAVALWVSVTIDATGQVVQSLEDFGLPPGPFVGFHALSVGLIAIFFTWSPRRASSGLDRLPPQEQVRRRSAVTLLVLAIAPVVGVEVWWQREEGWAVATGVAAGLALLALSSVRHLLSAGETTRLYSAVERAADERGRLLCEVMAHVDADRHRAAAHLHRQAVALYTAMAGFTSALDRPADGPAPTAVGIAAERMRVDLARQADELRRIAMAVEPLSGSGGGSHRLAAPVRAYIESLYGDAPRPEVTVEVGPELAPDWTTEAMALRIVQEATHNVWRHAHASQVRVAITASERALRIEIADDGVGFDPACAGRGIDTMRAMAGFLGGELDIATAPGRGTCVRAVVELMARPSPGRPHLRLVTD